MYLTITATLPPHSMPISTEAMIGIAAILVASVPIGVSVFKCWKYRTRDNSQGMARYLALHVEIAI
ncbi:hypothetical protein BDW59DRAFT_148118 [Aspergillus cavernicola]|uniref:Uncharacterized protein n=1 Tax=Aspergillus cavernicola TaxID=176166 RepID=A0ABR4I8J8_9EURO